MGALAAHYCRKSSVSVGLVHRLWTKNHVYLFSYGQPRPPFRCLHFRCDRFAIYWRWGPPKIGPIWAWNSNSTDILCSAPTHQPSWSCVHRRSEFITFTNKQTNKQTSRKHNPRHATPMEENKFISWRMINKAFFGRGASNSGRMGWQP